MIELPLSYAATTLFEIPLTRLAGRVPAPLAVLLGFGGFLLALQSIAPLVRLMTRQVHAHSAWHDSATRMFERASLPRRIYYLLAVAFLLTALVVIGLSAGGAVWLKRVAKEQAG